MAATMFRRGLYALPFDVAVLLVVELTRDDAADDVQGGLSGHPREGQ